MEESHFLTMMRMVQPHVSGRPKRSVELMLQSVELMHSVQQYQEPELSACDTGQDFVDFEALLTDLQTVCNPAEAEFINLILNFFRSRKIYSAYRAAAAQQNFQQSQTAQESSDASATLSTAEKIEPAFMEKENLSNTSSDHNNIQDIHFENQNANSNTLAADTNHLNTEKKMNGKNHQGPANTLRNFMGNQAFQSLLSPTQKENLNQIESLMQALT